MPPGVKRLGPLGGVPSMACGVFSPATSTHVCSQPSASRMWQTHTLLVWSADGLLPVVVTEQHL